MMRRMAMTEAWSTGAQIVAKRLEFEAALGPEYRHAAAWGVLHEDETDGLLVDRINVAGVDEHHLPAAVMATVLGYRRGSASIPFGAAEMDRAIEMLLPAEACTEFGHPNLWAWRALRSSLGPEPRFIAVFTDAIDVVNPADRYLDALLDAVHRGRQENADGTTTFWRPVGPDKLELWVPAEELEELDRHLVEPIEVVSKH